MTPSSVKAGLWAPCDLFDLVPKVMWACNFHAQSQRGSVCNMGKLWHLSLLCATNLANRFRPNSGYKLRIKSKGHLNENKILDFKLFISFFNWTRQNKTCQFLRKSSFFQAMYNDNNNKFCCFCSVFMLYVAWKKRTSSKILHILSCFV